MRRIAILMIQGQVKLKTRKVKLVKLVKLLFVGPQVGRDNANLTI